MDQSLKATMTKRVDGSALSYKQISVESGYDMLTISLHRTIRVPDNEKSFELPPDLGPFPIYSISDHKDVLPSVLAKKRGAFIPIYQREALWIRFRSKEPMAIKVYVGGVNAISGESKTAQRTSHESKQDYLVVPNQYWLDGIVTSKKMVSQFVATPLNSGYSVEEQITSADRIGGLQFEIIPPFREIYRGGFQLHIKGIQDNFYIFVQGSDTIAHVKQLLAGRQGYPPHMQRLFYNKELEDDRTLEYYNITRHDHKLCVLYRIRGGAIENDTPAEEISVAAGGSINQVIKNDFYDFIRWDDSRSIMFNVSLINAPVLGSFGSPVPTTPISAQTYAENGYPFFKLYEEPIEIFGELCHLKTLGRLKTVGKLDEEKGSNEPHDSEKELEFWTLEIGTWKQLIDQGLADGMGSIELGPDEEKSIFLPFHPANYKHYNY